MADLFKVIIPSIMNFKEPSLDEESSYVPFIVNKALTYHIDTILYANEMNRYHRLDKKLQYDYLFHSVKKMRRPFVPWVKKENTEHLDAIKELYGYSTQKAQVAYSILTEDQRKSIVEKMTIGGRSK